MIGWTAAYKCLVPFQLRSLALDLITQFQSELLNEDLAQQVKLLISRNLLLIAPNSTLEKIYIKPLLNSHTWEGVKMAA